MTDYDPIRGRSAEALRGAGWTDGEIEAHLLATGKSAGEVAAFLGRSPAPAGSGSGGAPLTLEAIRAMPAADQRKVATERWPEVKAALSGRRAPGPLSADELAHLDRLDADTINANWDQVKAELLRRGQEEGSKP